MIYRVDLCQNLEGEARIRALLAELHENEFNLPFMVRMHAQDREREALVRALERECSVVPYIDAEKKQVGALIKVEGLMPDVWDGPWDFEVAE